MIDWRDIRSTSALNKYREWFEEQTDGLKAIIRLEMAEHLGNHKDVVLVREGKASTSREKALLRKPRRRRRA